MKQINTENLFSFLSCSKHTTYSVICAPKYTYICPKIDKLNKQNMTIYEVGLCDIHKMDPSICLKKHIDKMTLFCSSVKWLNNVSYLKR